MLARTTTGQDGFTLVEMLVAMAAAIVIIFGLSAIMIVALHQSQRTFTRIDATRQARGALTTIENELHSGCTNGNQAPPIQAGSDANDLIFLSAPGGAASPTPTWHVLTFSPTAHTLVDTSYPAVANTGSTGAPWTQGSPGTATTLLTNVYQQTGLDPFQYYAYQAGSSDAGGTYWIVPDGSDPDPITGQTPNTPLSSPLSLASSNSTVEVRINLLVGPSSANLNNSSLTAAYDAVTDTVSMRLTTPPDEVPTGSNPNGGVPAGYGPCQ